MTPMAGGGLRELDRHRHLDGLRGLAILAVLATHVIFLDAGRSTWSLRGGFLGVDVFLVLSGFLIGGVLIRQVAATGTVDGRDFARRRLRRLLPPLVLLLAVQAPVALALGATAGEQVLQAVLALTFTSNWQLSFGHRAPFELVHLWSLSMEGQFYALCALGAWCVRRRLVDPAAAGRVAVRPLLFGLGAIALAAATWRIVLFERGVPLEALYERTGARLDSLALGVGALIVWRHRVVSDRVLRAGGAVGLGVLGVAWVVAEPSSTWLYLGGFTVIALAAGLVVAAAATGAGSVARLGDLRPLRWIGTISYSLYLWHLPIYIWVMRGLPDAYLWQRITIAVPASFIAAWLSFRLVESRVLADWRKGAPLTATASRRTLSRRSTR
jgi:peptidoglycan/LPS O-acetylase OafA/YrhL